MNCSTPPFKDGGKGDFACYGLWDFGNAFGDDQFMCEAKPQTENAYSRPGTGCVISTPACRTGKAVAERALDVFKPWLKDSSGIPLATDADVAVIASRLKTTESVARKELIRVWEYVCTGGAAGKR